TPSTHVTHFPYTTLFRSGFPRRSIIISFLQESALATAAGAILAATVGLLLLDGLAVRFSMGAFAIVLDAPVMLIGLTAGAAMARSEEHTSELQSRENLVC